MEISSKRVAVFLLPVLLSACATLPQDGSVQVPDGYPKQAQIADVPFFEQEAYQCGPATLAMVLGHLKQPQPIERLVDMVYSPDRQGSLQPFMVAGVRRLGLIAYPVKGFSNLIKELSAGNPVIILQNNGLSWLPRWHYAVATGYSEPDQIITLHSGALENYRIDWVRLYHTWKHSKLWGLVIVKPGDLPASAESQPLFLATASLEQAGFPEQAMTAYKALLQHWPNHLESSLAVANLYYHQGNLAKSRDWLLRAVESHPDSPVANNNLAQVLLELGHLMQALEHARAAVKLGGPFAETARQTLNEISEAVNHE